MAQSRKQPEHDSMAGPDAHDPGQTAEKLLREQPTLAPLSPTEASGAAGLPALSGPPDSVQPFGQAGSRVVDRFEVISELGSGGFGTVYKAHDPELRRDVAIKVPHRHRVASPKDAEAYLAEARILASLDHVHIVPVYDVGRTADGLCYVVSKFIEGCDLAGQIQRSCPTTEQSAELVATVADALHYAHRKGLVHRDI